MTVDSIAPVAGAGDASPIFIPAGGGAQGFAGTGGPSVGAPVQSGRLGGEILVNTAVSGGQSSAVVTTLAGGGFVVVWSDLSLGVGGATGDSSAGAVKAQVFTADGVPVGSEILVNTATAGDQYLPVVAALANGGFAVSWADFSQGVGGATGDASGYAVKTQVFTAAGATVGGEILVNTATQNSQDNPQIVGLPNGGFVVTWRDASQGAGGATGDASNYAVKAQVFTSTGAAVGGEILVNTATQGAQTAQEITVLSDGGFVITWTDGSLGVGGATGDSSSNAIKAQVFAADGTAVGGEILVNTATAGSQGQNQITALADGGFVVTWNDFSLGVGGAGGDTSSLAVKAQVFAADGTPTGSEIRVNTATQNSQSNPQITALAHGGFVVTWRDVSQGNGGATGDGSSYAIKAQVFAADGSPVGGEILANTAISGPQTNPQIAALPDGGFVITWEDASLGVGGATGDNSGFAIKAQVFAADGTPRGEELLVNTAISGDQITAHIAVLDQGFVVTWQDLSQGVGGATGDNSNYAIKSQVFNVGPAAVELVPLDLKSTGFTVSDPDAGDVLTVTLSTDYGLLTVTAGGSGAIVSNSGTASVTIVGTATQIDALLNGDATSTFSFLANTGAPPSTATVTLAVDDGAGGTASAAFLLPIEDLPGAAPTAGPDTLTGTAGADVIDADAGNDYVNGGDGNDTLYGENNDDTLNGGNGSDKLYGGDGVDILNGDDGNDRLDGGAGIDTLNGGAGNDVLDGGTGADAMSGGTGNDIYYVDDAGDTTTENAAEGYDIVRSTITWTLAGNIEGLQLQGAGDIDGTGNALANNIVGNAGKNTLHGGDGVDTIDGGDGNDYVYGDDGGDHLKGGLGSDTVDGGAGNDDLDGGDGNDKLYGGSGYDSLIGGQGNDRLDGGADNDVLDGGDGNDVLDGGTGNDTLRGGVGNDVYYVDSVADSVVENAGEGYDIVRNSVNWTLGANIEGLQL
ncbi:MAG: hypothetical protein GC145_14105, partial [Caulobacter sp.]|nr:hypothetical protein [Caulobacter sp.]